MTIYDALRKDHEKVKDMVAKLKSTGDGAAKTRDKLFTQMKQELEIHTEFENEVFYPAVAENARAKQAVEDAVDEHEQTDILLDDLTDTDKTSPAFADQVEKLEQMLLHHISDEEKKLFPLAQETISEERADEMGRQYEKQKQQELKKAS